ncbi:MAG TPA: hypothetical protein VFN78_05955 [Ktedonobacterales bacterium]|nr:hypothetical protein [Ktedonobacterales bacterium]
MPKMVDEYVRRWEVVVAGTEVEGLPYDAEIGPQSALFFQSARSTPMGDGVWIMPDFGDAICFFRYIEIPDELELPKPPTPDENEANAELAATLPGLAMMQASWEQRRPKITDEKLLARKARADEALDALLADYVREGYTPEMANRLRQTVNAAMLDWEVEEIWILPDDLDELLEYSGNPLTDHYPYEDDDDQREAEAAAPTFDLNAPAHRAALKQRLHEMFL